MDSHDVGRDRGGEIKALGELEQPALVVGIDSDALYPISEQEALSTMIPQCDFHVIKSDEGHDGFLLEQDQIGDLIEDFLDKQE